MDVGIFGPLGNAFSKRCDEVLQDTGQEIPEKNFVKEYMQARGESFKPETIRKAFEKSGIRPLDPTVFTDEDFAPSIASSTQAHVPPSYPQATFGYQRYSPVPIIRDDPHLDGDADDSDDDDSSDEDEDTIMDTETSTTHPADASLETHPPIPRPSEFNPTSDHSAAANSAESEPVPPPPPPAEGQDGPATPTTMPINNDDDLPFPVPVLGNEHQRRAREPLVTPGMSKTAQIDVLMDEVERLRAENQRLNEKLDESRTHCAIAAGRIGDYKKRANTKDTRTTRRSTKADLGARWTTGGTGRVQFDALMAEKKEKARKKEEEKKCKEVAQAQKQAERYARGPTEVFSGSLSTKNKDDLMEIVTALAIPLPMGKRYTKADLIDKIKSHLDTHADQLGHRKIRVAGCVHCMHIHGLACTCMARSLRA